MFSDFLGVNVIENNVESIANLIYGKNAVLECLKSDKSVDILYISSTEDERQAKYYTALAKEKGAVIKRVPADKLEELCGSRRHQGLVAITSLIEYSDVKDFLLAARKKGEDPFILIADGIEDPHNLGAIIRTAEAAGVHGIVIPKRGGVPVNATVQRASAGAVSHLPIARVANLANVVRDLKKEGLFCYAADMDGEDIYRVNLKGPIAVVVGSEGNGISRLLKDLCDVSVSLPMKGEIGSLNASVAAGVVLYEVLRQRML